jgi:hypothetical protein
MPTARNLMPTVESNGIIYAIGGILGGLSSTSVVEAYDTSTGSWTAKTPLPIPLGSSSGSAFTTRYTFLVVVLTVRMEQSWIACTSILHI